MPRGRPHQWTPEEKPRRLAYHRQRCQARFRGEEWLDSFTFEQWWEIWQPYWHNRGQASTDYQMSRCDPEKSWNYWNVMIIERKKFYSELYTGTHRAGRPRKI